MMSVATQGNPERPLAVWLFGVAFLVFCMILLGGITRLTQSGLSMVEWRPLMGILPPLDDAAWQAVFTKYQQFPEYKHVNDGMALADFKRIFWFEYAHRLLGRLIGFAFAAPFVVFALMGRMTRRRWLPLTGLFILGGLQGLIGWWMVKSGLIDRPDVSHYRLTLHLGLAISIFGALLWLARALWRGPSDAQQLSPSVGHLQGHLHLAVCVVFLQILLGAMVAGLDAGRIYNSFPDMNGAWLPADGWQAALGWRNLVENPVTLQFQHRMGAYLVLLVLVALWWRARKVAAPIARRTTGMLILALLQAGLGIATLLGGVPVFLALSHQGVALVLLTACLFAAQDAGPDADLARQHRKG